MKKSGLKREEVEIADDGGGGGEDFRSETVLVNNKA